MRWPVRVTVPEVDLVRFGTNVADAFSAPANDFDAGVGTSTMLGNVVISKQILRTRKIMVMHSNEREECCLRTLIDRKRKH